MDGMGAARGARPGLGWWWRVAAALWLLPGVAMYFSDDIRWGALDFAVFGAMLALAAGGFELAVRMARGAWQYRAGAAIALAGGFLLTWTNLAVGVIGDEGEAVNLAFFGVLLLGGLGAVVVRGEARGLAAVMVAMALAQSAVSGVAYGLGLGATPVLAWGFVGVWLGAAALFLEAARRRA